MNDVPRGSSGPPDDTAAAFQHALDQEVLRSERLRMFLVAGAGAILALYSLLVIWFVPEHMRIIYGDDVADDPVYILPLSLLGLVVYALVSRKALGWRLEQQKAMSPLQRYGGVAFEVSFISILLAVLRPYADPIFLLVSPAILVFPLFIAASTLQMNPRVSLFAGGLAGVEFLALSLWFRGNVDPAAYPPWLLAPTTYSSRVLLLVLVGGVAAFAAGQIRKRVLGLLMTTEEKNRITRTFGQHVSPQVVERLLQQRQQSESESRHVCIMFLDIRGFTTFSESRTADEVVETLNRLFTFMIDITNEHDGIINKFLGDGFMAVFGAPFSDGQDCVNAVNASRRIIERMERENRESGLGLQVGIGLHAGQAVTGNVGSAARKEYTVIGDTVNVASRIEGLNKQFGSQVLLSEEVRAALPEDQREFTDLGAVPVKGRKAEVRVFQLA